MAVYHGLQDGPVVISLPPPVISLRARGIERYGLVMILEGKAEQALVFLSGDQLESPAIASFLRIGAASLCVCGCAVGVIASGLDSPCGTADVAVITGQIQRLEHPPA